MRILITLGGPLNTDCTPSHHLKSRLDETIRQYRQDDVVIVTGSRTRGMALSEAFIMSEYLKNNGLNNIVLEELATSTVENAYFTRKLIENMNVKSDTEIVVITSDFHLPRTSLIFLHYFTSGSISFLAARSNIIDTLSDSEVYKFTNLLTHFPPVCSVDTSIISYVIRGNMCGVKSNIDKIDQVDKNNGNTTLHYSASYGFLDITTFLLDSGVNINAKNYNDMTPLHYAIINGQIDTILELLERGASIDIQAKNHRWNMTSLNAYDTLINIRPSLSSGVYTVILLMLIKYRKKQNSIVWIRHAESELNRALSLKQDTSGIIDAKITKDGKEMVEFINRWILKANLLADYKVIVSPLFRTLETAKHLINGVDGIVPVVDHRICELLNHTACIGTPKSELSELFNYDFSSIPEEWWYKPEKNNRSTISITPEDWTNLNERLATFYKELVANMTTKSNILVVTHGGVIWSVYGSKIQVRNCDSFETVY